MRAIIFLVLKLKKIHLQLFFLSFMPPLFSKSSDSETQTSQNLGTIIVETSQKISPVEDGADQKESDQTEDSQKQGKEIVQIYSNTTGKTPKVNDMFCLTISYVFIFILCFIT